MGQNINVSIIISAPIKKVWEFYTFPQYIIKWNAASSDWHTTKSENDLRVGGKFSSRMESKDGSFGFDYSGIYNQIEKFKSIQYTIDDGRKVAVNFVNQNDKITIDVIFEAEDQNTIKKNKRDGKLF